jgi:alkanesulfonate monooxygenase SsuD/methylene tetrahydromethanopterin reductase-like flavin-dependent oxidoreductase (luciferase family)
VGEAAHDQPGVVTGAPERVTERLLEFTRMGFQAFNFLVEGPAPEEQAERISREVIPVLRAA